MITDIEGMKQLVGTQVDAYHDGKASPSRLVRVVIDDECKELKKWLGGHVVDCADDLPHGLTEKRAKAAIAVLKAGHAVPKPKTSCGCEGGC